MDVQKWLRKKETLNHEFVNTSWESLENLIEAALAQDRKELEEYVSGVTVGENDTAYTILAKIRERFRQGGA